MKKQFHRLLSLTLVITIMLLLCACGNNSSVEKALIRNYWSLVIDSDGDRSVFVFKFNKNGTYEAKATTLGGSIDDADFIGSYLIDENMSLVRLSGELDGIDLDYSLDKGDLNLSLSGIRLSEVSK